MAYQGKDILPLARSKVGQKYVLGARAPLMNPNWSGPWDCAEFASWCAYQTYRIIFGVEPSDPSKADAFSGFWYDQASAGGLLISVEEALKTPGAFLLRKPRAKLIGHIAICAGGGGLVEAAGAKVGVVERPNTSDRRWDAGCLLPGVAYKAGAAGPELGPAPEIIRLTNPFTRGPKVKAIQQALLAQGIHPGKADGIFGEQTEAAVAAFQNIHGLIVDGEVGPLTAAALGL